MGHPQGGEGREEIGCQHKGATGAADQDKARTCKLKPSRTAEEVSTGLFR